jgi:hypothetical protein
VSCCVEQTNGSPPGGGGTPTEGILLFDHDWRTFDAQVLVDGPNVIPGTGATWTGSNIASGATLLDIQPGIGLVFDANGVSTAYTNASRSAARIGAVVSSLIPTFQDTWSIVIETYWTLLTLPSGNNRVFVGFDAIPTTVNTLMGAGRRNSGGQVGYSQVDGGFGGLAVVNPDDAIMSRIDARGINSMGGIYDAGNDAFPAQYPNSWGALIATSPLAVPAMSVNSLLTIAFPTGVVAGTMAAALGRMRATLVES